MQLITHTIYFLLLKPAKLPFLRGLKTGQFGRECTGLWIWPTPLSQRIFLKSSYTTRSTEYYLTHQHTHLLMQKIYSPLTKPANLPLWTDLKTGRVQINGAYELIRATIPKAFFMTKFSYTIRSTEYYPMYAPIYTTSIGQWKPPKDIQARLLLLRPLPWRILEERQTK